MSRSITTIWLGCDITFLSPSNNSVTASDTANATNATNAAYYTQLHRLETTCPTLLATRIVFYSSFLLLSSCLLFSFVRHHIKYDRSNVLCTGIETERHRVVVALFVGTFARSLSFVVDEDYMSSNHESHQRIDYIHKMLRVTKDICFVQAFSLVVEFWLTLLRTVEGTTKMQGTWNVSWLRVCAVIVFAVCRVLIAIIRPIVEAHGASTQVDLLLFGILSFSYFLLFCVALMHGRRLHKRLARVGPMVKRNMLRLRAFMAVEISFCILLAVSTLFRTLVFTQLGYTRGENPTLHYAARTTVKGTELGLVATLTLLMIARTRSRPATREGEEAHSNSARMPAQLDSGRESTITPNDEWQNNWEGHGRQDQHDDALFDRNSFAGSMTSHSIQDSLGGSSTLSHTSEIEIPPS
jgi:hypothetical protein